MTLTADQWENFVAVQQGHLLQSWAWGQLKSRFGWVASQVHTGGNAGAQILFRRLPLGLTNAEIDNIVVFLESLTGDNVETLVRDAFAAPVGDRQ